MSDNKPVPCRPTTPLPRVRFQWQRNDVSIPGANKFSYIPTEEDVGQKLTRVADYMSSRSDKYEQQD